jgi:hypothetical protein
MGFFTPTPRKITEDELKKKVERDLYSSPYFRHLPDYRDYVTNNLKKLLDVDPHASGNQAGISEEEVKKFVNSLRDPTSDDLEEQRRYNIKRGLTDKQLDSLEEILNRHL